MPTTGGFDALRAWLSRQQHVNVFVSSTATCAYEQLAHLLEQRLDADLFGSVTDVLHWMDRVEGAVRADVLHGADLDEGVARATLLHRAKLLLRDSSVATHGASA